MSLIVDTLTFLTYSPLRPSTDAHFFSHSSKCHLWCWFCMTSVVDHNFWLYSQVSNKRACSFINFQHFAPSARFFPPCSFINFQKNFHPARLFHPCSIIPSYLLLPSCTARLFLFYKKNIYTLFF